MKYKLAIFDFDGTLADSFPFFVSVFNQLADEYNFKKIDLDFVDSYRHYDAKQMMELVGMPKWQLPIVGKRFMSLMKANASFINLFDGITEALTYLTQRGVKVAVVSSNSYENVNQILGDKTTKLVSTFDCGMSIFGKAARLEKVLRSIEVKASEAIYIGDQLTDLEAAQKKSIAFGAVAWGYATLESLEARKPTEVFSNPQDLQDIANRID